MVINELEDAHLLFAEAFNSGDMDSIMALYEPEATLVPQSGQAVKGISATGEALQGFLALKVRIIVETQYIVRTEDVALMCGKWSLGALDPMVNP